MDANNMLGVVRYVVHIVGNKGNKSTPEDEKKADKYR